MSIFKQSLWYLFSALLIVSNLGCRSVNKEDSSVDSLVDDDVGALWQTSEIPVCWENPSIDPLVIKSQTEMEAIVVSEYRRAGFEFVGWKPCAEASKGVRIRMEDQRPFVRAFGARLDGMVDGVLLPVTYKAWSPWCSETEERRAWCVRTDALHEFGHVLGLRHEHNYPGSRSPCRDEYIEWAAKVILPFDEQSIMNYCAQRERRVTLTPMVLSDGDLNTLTLYYSGTVKLWTNWDEVQKQCEEDGYFWKKTDRKCASSPDDIGANVWLPPDIDRGAIANSCVQVGGTWFEDDLACKIGPYDHNYYSLWPPSPRCKQVSDFDLCHFDTIKWWAGRLKLKGDGFEPSFILPKLFVEPREEEWDKP